MTAEILDKAIAEIRNGAEISAVVSNYPVEVQSELQAMLEIFALATSLPRKAVPTPAKRRLYLQHQPKAFSIASLFESLRLAPIAMGAFLLVLTGTAYAAQSSLPGEKLFVVKKSYESLQVKLATNPEKRADLQLQIAAQRFEDAQKVLANDSNEDSKKQAIEELNQQTVVALNDIKSSAVSISNNNPDLVKKAEDLTKNQSSLVATADPKIVDSTALKKTQESKIALKDIKTLIAAANEESGATIAPVTKITLSGPITAVKDNTITMAKNQFVVDSETIIATNENHPLTLADLSVGQQISIEAKVSAGKNIAEVITVTVAKPKEEKPVDKTPDKSKETIPVIPIKETPKEKPIIEPVVLPSPELGNDTFGGFIPEPPVDYTADQQ